MKLFSFSFFYLGDKIVDAYDGYLLKIKEYFYLLFLSCIDFKKSSIILVFYNMFYELFNPYIEFYVLAWLFIEITVFEHNF